MCDHTEREREAVKRLRGQVSTPTTMTIAEREQYADALIAAVRAAVLAEVRAKVERYMEEGCGCGCDADDHADAFNGILAALTALEATVEDAPRDAQPARLSGEVL